MKQPILRVVPDLPGAPIRVTETSRRFTVEVQAGCPELADALADALVLPRPDHHLDEAHEGESLR